VTRTQRCYLQTLSEQSHLADAYVQDLNKADASKRIDGIKKFLGFQ